MELKHVSQSALEALHTLHEDGFMYTGKLFPLPECFLPTIVLDVKLGNILVNNGQEDVRCANVQLGDCHSTCHVDQKYAKSAATIGATIWRSPESMLRLPSDWNTATDICSGCLGFV